MLISENVGFRQGRHSEKNALSNDKKVNFPRRHTTQTYVYLTTEYQNMQGKPW